MAFFSADVSIFVDDVIKNPTKTKNPITREPLIVEKWLTPQINAVIKLYSENVKWMTHLEPFLLTSALFEQKIGK